jgi:MFS transporter, DHA3 family, macrolide efflux protein
MLNGDFEEPKNLKKFYPMVIGQGLSMFGTSQTAFAMGIWVLKETGSIMRFTTVLTFMGLGSIICAPFAGTIVDRFDRKTLMILADSVAGLASLCLAFLFYRNVLEFWHLCAYMTIVAIMNSLQAPAFSASFRYLVPMSQMGRAIGLLQSSVSVGKIASPLTGVFLLERFGFGSIIIADFATFIIGVLVLVPLKIPSSAPNPNAPRTSFWADIKAGFSYVGQQKALVVMMFYGFFNLLFLSMWDGLFVPLFLVNNDVSTLGSLVSLVGFGSLAGGIAMTIWGGPKLKRMPVVLVLGLIQALIFAGFALFQSKVLYGIFIFGLFAILPMTSTLRQVILQYKVDPRFQGRVFALSGIFGQVAMPLAYVLVGPLAEKYFAPQMMEGGSLATIFGGLLGVGDGRGLALMLFLIGVTFLLLTLMAAMPSKVRNLDTELPDGGVFQPQPKAPEGNQPTAAG